MAGTRKDNGAKSRRSRIFRALGDENRILLLESLFGGPATVSLLCSQTGLEQSLTSHHLASLKREGLVESRRTGKEVTYRLARRIFSNRDAPILNLGCCKITMG